jgi:hypothetical protein
MSASGTLRCDCYHHFAAGRAALSFASSSTPAPHTIIVSYSLSLTVLVRSQSCVFLGVERIVLSGFGYQSSSGAKFRKKGHTKLRLRRSSMWQTQS